MFVKMVFNAFLTICMHLVFILVFLLYNKNEKEEKVPRSTQILLEKISK